jgi:hypothetical protein
MRFVDFLEPGCSFFAILFAYGTIGMTGKSLPFVGFPDRFTVSCWGNVYVSVHLLVKGILRMA